MADKDGDGPSLELPSLGFGRKRGKKARDVEADATTTPEAGGPPESGSESGSEPVAEPAPAVRPQKVAEPDPGPDPVAEPAPAVPPQQIAEPDPHPAEPQTTAGEARPEPPTAPMPAAAPPLFADEAREGPDRSGTVPDDGTDTQDEEETAARPRRQFSLPAVSSMTAALITGAVAGVLLVGLTGLGFRLCEVIQGTSSCGDPGFLLLAAIVVVVVIVGKTMLDAWSVTDPGSTSFLAVGLLCVVALLFLVDVLFSWWMIIVIPVLSMLCFALSHWVTTAFVEIDE